MVLPKFKLVPDQANYVYAAATTVVTTTLEGGLSRQRADFPKAAALITVQWTFDTFNYQYFTAFYNNALGRGSKPFLLDLLLDQPFLQEHVCKFVGPFTKSDPKGMSRIVNAQLEAVAICDDEFDESLLYLHDNYDPCEIDGLLGKLDNFVNLRWPLELRPGLLEKLVNVDLDVK